MVHKINICPNRYLVTKRRSIGTQGEHNATILEFSKPSEINGEPIEHFKCEIVFNFEFGGNSQSYVYELPSDDCKFKIKAELTVARKLTLMVRFLKNTDVKWKSYPLSLFFAESADDSGISNIVVPHGTLTIGKNGTYDVKNFATASVNVKTYEDELNELINGMAEVLQDVEEFTVSDVFDGESSEIISEE